MDVGIAMFTGTETVDPGTFARLAEEADFESVWVPEHTHIPASRETPYPAGGDLPPEYARIYDPFIALAMAAAATERVRLGTGLTLVSQRDPITLAKEVATLDQLSGGRVLFGVGFGWNVEEMRNHGTDPSKRFGLVRERVEAMKTIWAQEVASYEGKHVGFEDIWSWPKPAQDPHPPILVGGNGERVLDRVLRYGDGWYPNILDDDWTLGRVRELRERAADAGRSVTVTLNAAPRDPSRLARYEAEGIERVVFWLRPGDRDYAASTIERLVGVLREWRGAG